LDAADGEHRDERLPRKPRMHFPDEPRLVEQHEAEQQHRGEREAEEVQQAEDAPAEVGVRRQEVLANLEGLFGYRGHAAGILTERTSLSRRPRLRRSRLRRLPASGRRLYQVARFHGQYRTLTRAAHVRSRSSNQRKTKKLMNLHEYQSKALFAEYGIPIPKGRVAASEKEACQAAEALGGQLWVVKAQVHAGGRGKAGGVKLAKSVDEVSAHAKAMLGKRLVTHQSGPEGLP